MPASAQSREPRRPRSNTLSRQLFRYRWVLAAAFIAAATMVAIDAFDSAPTATSPALVATKDLNAGDQLTESNTEIRGFPPELVPGDAHTKLPADSGRVMIHAASKGTVIGEHLAPPPGIGPSGPPGTVVTPVRFADPAIAAMVGPGTRVNVLAARPQFGEKPTPAEVVATGAFVVAAKETSASGLIEGQRQDNSPVLLAVTPAEAIALAGASGQATFSIVILPTDPS